MFRNAPDATAGKERLAETWESARTTLAPRISAAREAVAPYVDQATTRVAPVLEEARTRVGPAMETARDRFVTDVMPTVTHAVGTAKESSAPARTEAKERAAAALLALQGKQRKARRWPIALVSLFAGAIAGLAAGTMMRGRQPTQLPPPPTPFPARDGESPSKAQGSSTGRGSATPSGG